MMKTTKKATIRTAALALVLLCVLIAALAREHVQKQLYPRHYVEYVTRYAEQYDVPIQLVYAVIDTESGFRADATSSAGAIGLMQLMPTTFEWLTEYQLKENLPARKISDPEINVRYGVFYLRWLYDRYGHWPEACAAYNAGHGNVDAWLADDTMTDQDGRLLIAHIPLNETRAYVKRVQNAYHIYADLYSDGHAPSFD